MTNVQIVTRPGSDVVHLALLFNAFPLCGRGDSDVLEITSWLGADDPRRLCQHCQNVLYSLGNWASLFKRDAS